MNAREKKADSGGRVAFVLERNVYLKFYLSVIDALLARGVPVDVWYLAQPQERSGPKQYQFVVPAELPPRLLSTCHVVGYENEADLIRLAEERAVGVVLSLRPKYQVLPDRRKALRCRFVTLQHGLDTFLPVHADLAGYGDEMLLYTDDWIAMGERIFSQKGDQFRAAYREHFAPRARAVGWPGLDVLKTLDKASVARKLGLPSDRRIVTYLPLGVLDNSAMTARTRAGLQLFVEDGRLAQVAAMARSRRFGPWKSLVNGWTERRLVKCLHEFCERNGAVLVAKGREKDPLRPLVVDMVDRHFYDLPDYDPPILLELLSISDLVVHFDSTAVLEAAAAGVASISIETVGRTADDLRDMGDEVFFNHELEGPLNYDGVNSYWTLRRFLSDFAQTRLDDFKVDADRCRSYQLRWTGRIDGQSGQRAATAIQAHLAGVAPRLEPTRLE